MQFPSTSLAFISVYLNSDMYCQSPSFIQTQHYYEVVTANENIQVIIAYFICVCQHDIIHGSDPCYHYMGGLLTVACDYGNYMGVVVYTVT